MYSSLQPRLFLTAKLEDAQKKNSHRQDFYRSGVAEKVPFLRLWASPLHTGGSLGSGLVPAREAEPVGPPWGAGGGFPRWPSPNSPGPSPWPGTAPPTPAKALAEARREERPRRPCSIPAGHPLPHPLLRPRAAPGRAHPHRNLPQPNPVPCRDANPPGGTRTGDPKPRGCPCTPSWPRTPGLSLDVGVACHMWSCPGWPWLPLSKAMSPESSTQVWELPCTQGCPPHSVLAWARLG